MKWIAERKEWQQPQWVNGSKKMMHQFLLSQPVGTGRPSTMMKKRFFWSRRVVVFNGYAARCVIMWLTRVSDLEFWVNPTFATWKWVLIKSQQNNIVCRHFGLWGRARFAHLHSTTHLTRTTTVDDYGCQKCADQQRFLKIESLFSCLLCWLLWVEGANFKTHHNTQMKPVGLHRLVM